MPDDKTIDFVIAFISLGLLALGVGSWLLGWVVQAFDRVRGSANQEAEPEPARSAAIPHMNAIEPDEPRSLNAGELLLNAAEIAAISRMIEHNRTAAKPSKSSTIQAGFGIARGGSAAYQRASHIYDLLFGPPEPAIKYRPLTPEQSALRSELGLEKR